VASGRVRVEGNRVLGALREAGEGMRAPEGE